MDITISIPDSVMITVPKPKDWTGPTAEAVPFDLTKITPAIAAKLLLHGAQQKAVDGAGGKDNPTPADKRKVILATIEGLEAGDWGRERTSDPVKAEARKLATAKIQKMPAFVAWATKAGKKAGDKEFAAMIAKNLDKVMADPAIQAEAKERVEKASALTVDESGLDFS